MKSILLKPVTVFKNEKTSIGLLVFSWKGPLIAVVQQPHDQPKCHLTPMYDKVFAEFSVRLLCEVFHFPWINFVEEINIGPKPYDNLY